MTSKLAIFLSGTLLALGACNKHEAATDNAANDLNMTVTDNGAMNGEANAIAPSPLTAQGFANAAAASDHFEIESSKLAARQASSAAVKKFAAQMITAHTGSTAKLKSTLAGMNPPMTADDTLNAEQQAALDGLKGKTGADFDSAYAAAQVNAHQKTLDALNAYAEGGDNDALKTFAKGLITTVTAHLNLAKGLK